MRYYELITEDTVPSISPQQARDMDMYGPIYHGTTYDLGEIVKQGFDASKSIPQSMGKGYQGLVPVGNNSNGMPFMAYGLGIAAPIHFLGFGTYFTTVKTIAKQFAGGTMKGQKEFYLDSNKILKINFGSSDKMMKWWIGNGYDMTVKATMERDFDTWANATKNLTENLSSRYDAVHFLGKGLRKLLDGDQICVYDTALIRMVDKKLASGLEIGSKVFHTQEIPVEYRNKNNIYVGDSNRPGWKAIYNAEFELKHDRKVAFHEIPPPNIPGIIVNVRERQSNKTKMYDVKWQRGGACYNYDENELSNSKKS